MQSRHIKFYCSIVLLLCCGFFAAAQEMAIRQYTTRQGLPIDQVNCAAQDNNGFMWFGTDFGIVYSDGRNFKQYYQKEGILNKAVMDITATNGDSLVFISYPDAIQSIHPDGHIVTLVKNFAQFKPQLIERVGDRFLFYQSNTNQFGVLSKTNKVSIINIDSLIGMNGILLNKIIPLPGTNNYVLCTNKGAFFISGGRALAVTGNIPITSGLFTRKGKLLLAGEQQFYATDTPDRKTNALPVNIPVNFRAVQMLEESDEQVLIRSTASNVLSLKSGVLTDITAKLSLENKAIRRFFHDGDKSTWFCTDGAGIILKKKTAFTGVSPSPGLPDNNIECLYPVKKGILVGTGNGLALYQNNSLTRVPVPGAKGVAQHIHQLFNAGNMGVGVAMSGAETGGSNYRLHQSAAGAMMLSNTFFSSVSGNDTWIFDAGKKSLQVYQNGNQKPVREIELGFSGCRKVYSMIVYNGQRWIGTDKGIVKINSTHNEHIDSLNGKGLQQVFKLLVSKKNILWVATDVGLFYFDGRRFSTVPENSTYTGNYCTDITEDDEGNIWVATWNGIYHTNGFTKKHFNIQDGLVSRTVNCILFNSDEKKIIAGTNNGLSVLYLADTLAAFNKRAFIHCYLRDSLQTPVFMNSVLQPGNYKLLFDISIPEYGNPEEISIQYRLDNGKWFLTNNFKVNMDDIRSGKHRFYVRPYSTGSNITGMESEFVFTIKEPFYRRWWFILIAVALAQAIVIALLALVNKRNRQKAMRKHQQLLELATLRQKAFTTLINPHFIFNALNSIQHYINKQDRQAANRYLSDFASLIRRNFDAAQQAFIPLDQELENIRLYLQLEKMRFPEKFEYELFVAEEIDVEELAIPTMILQPFLENAVLHGLSPRTEKGLLQVTVTRQEKAVHITITDNGIGIERSRMAQANSRHKSRGMKLIREKLEVLSRFGDAPVTLDIKEAFPGEAYPGVRIDIIIPDSVYENFPGEAVVHW
jgi:ligand-binding sensor domain-containing protein